MLISFPPRIYRSVGPSSVVPHLLETFSPDIPLAIQFLRNGVVRVTFADAAPCNALLEKGLWLDNTRLEIRSADPRLRTVHLRDLPVEVSDDDVLSFLGRFGTVRSMTSSCHSDFPNVLDGNRSALVVLTDDIPCFVRIAGSDCRVWYARQPAQCSICRVAGHRAPDCPLTGRCRRCKQPGHMARDCRHVWFDARSSKSVDSPASVAEPVTAPVVDSVIDAIDDVVDIAPEPVVDVSEPAVDVSEPAADVSESAANVSEPAVDVSEPAADVPVPVIVFESVVASADPVPVVDIVPADDVPVADSVTVPAAPCVSNPVAVPAAASISAAHVVGPVIEPVADVPVPDPFASSDVTCVVQDHSGGNYCPDVWFPSGRRALVYDPYGSTEYGFIDAGKHTNQVIHKDLHVDYCRYLQYLNTPEIRPAICQPSLRVNCLPNIPPCPFPGTPP